jgi:hypothetical protein
MKRLVAFFSFLPLLPSCNDSSDSSVGIVDSTESESQPTELSLSIIFGDVIISDRIKFSDDRLVEPALRNCVLHQAPIYRKNGYHDGIRRSYMEEYITYLGLAAISGYCPNMSPYGIEDIDTTPRWSGATPYSIEYCRACNHVFQIGMDRFFELPENEQIRWQRFVRESLFLNR